MTATSDAARARRRSALGHRLPKRSTPGKRSGRSRSSSRQKSRKPRPHKIPHVVEEAISGEVLRLFRACTLLRCLCYPADYGDGDKEFVTAVAETTYELVNRAIRGLDIGQLRHFGQDGGECGVGQSLRGVP